MQADFRTKWKLLCLFSRLNIFYASEQRSVFLLEIFTFLCSLVRRNEQTNN